MVDFGGNKSNKDIRNKDEILTSNTNIPSECLKVNLNRLSKVENTKLAILCDKKITSELQNISCMIDPRYTMYIECSANNYSVSGDGILKTLNIKEESQVIIHDNLTIKLGITSGLHTKALGHGKGIDGFAFRAKCLITNVYEECPIGVQEVYRFVIYSKQDNTCKVFFGNAKTVVTADINDITISDYSFKTDVLDAITNIVTFKENNMNTTIVANRSRKVAATLLGLFSNEIESVRLLKNKSIIQISKDALKDVKSTDYTTFDTLAKLGVTVLLETDLQTKEVVISTDKLASWLDTVECGTDDTAEISYTDVTDLEALQEKIIYGEEHVKLEIAGVDEQKNIYELYLKLYNTCKSSSNFKWFNGGWTKQSVLGTQAQSLKRLTNIDDCLSIKDFSLKNEIAEVIKNYYTTSEKFKNTSESIALNKLKFIVNTVNNMELSKNDTVTFYGELSGNELMVMDILSRSYQLSVIWLISDLCFSTPISKMNNIELSESDALKSIEDIEKENSTVKTMAARAKDKTDKILFNGDTLGMYKPDMFNKYDIKNFETTYDEIKLWLGTEMYERPGFTVDDDTVEIPTICSILSGVSGDKNVYVANIHSLVIENTIYCNEINGLDKLTLWDSSKDTLEVVCKNSRIKCKDSVLDLLKQGELNRKAIKQAAVNPYSLLSPVKQEAIMSAIEELICGHYIKYEAFGFSQKKYNDLVINICMYMNTNVIRLMQLFEGYNHNPNLVCLAANEDKISLTGMIVLTFLRLLGFDILIFVPTCYTTIEDVVGKDFLYSKQRIGNVRFDIYQSDTTYDTEKVNKSKESIFKKIGKLFS